MSTSTVPFTTRRPTASPAESPFTVETFRQVDAASHVVHVQVPPSLSVDAAVDRLIAAMGEREAPGMPWATGHLIGGDSWDEWCERRTCASIAALHVEVIAEDDADAWRTAREVARLLDSDAVRVSRIDSTWDQQVPEPSPARTATRTTTRQAREHFAAGGTVVVSEHGEQQITVTAETTTHSRETATWEWLTEQVDVWRARYPGQAYYVVTDDEPEQVTDLHLPDGACCDEPDADDTPDDVLALAVPCPTCSAGHGQPCATAQPASRGQVLPHVARVVALHERAATHVPAGDEPEPSTFALTFTTTATRAEVDAWARGVMSRNVPPGDVSSWEVTTD